MRPTAPPVPASPLLALALVLTACDGGPGAGDPGTVEVVHNRSTDNNIRFKDACLESVKKQFEKAHPARRSSPSRSRPRTTTTPPRRSR
ncbi:hypothetical protein [Streptomyces sp. NPDC096153]|uniref:hypothetical protein n=1 Tax=Streptomyces sp. NPDC096153 TaxID=3155548 RepID=UPI0033259E3F